MATLAELQVVIGAQTAEFDRAIKSVEGRVNSFGSKLGSIASGIGAYFAVDKVLGFGKAALSAAGDIQALEKGFAATYKGGEDLSVALAKVRDLAKLPGLGLKEALQGATNLQAAGFSADLATRALGAFGNALATVGRGKADLDGVGLALGQIASKGKISAEEINQLAERVPQIRQAMQAAFGTADTEALQKAKISATDFVEGVTRELEKLPKVTGGLNNAFENLGDASTTALAKLGTALNNGFGIEGKVSLLSDAVNSLGDDAAALEPTFRAIAAYFGEGGEGGRLFDGLAESARNASGELRFAFDAMNGGQKSVSALQAEVRELAVGFTALSDVAGGTIGSISRALKGDFVGSEKEAERALYGLIDPIANLLGFTKKASAELKGSFDSAFRIPEGFNGLSGAVGDFGPTITKVAEAATAAEKALAKLQKELLDNANASRALGDLYDYSGGKAKALESGIKNLTGAGFAPGGKVVQGYVEQLRGVPEALDQIASRLAKGVLKDAPEFKVKVRADYGGDLDAANGRNPYDLPGRVAPVAAPDISAPLTAYDTLSGAAREAFRGMTQAQADFNANTAALTEAFPLDAFSAIGQAIGQSLGDGGDVLEAAGQALLKSIASIGAQYGQFIIALGIADVATGFNAAKGVAEIIAGTALIAASGVLGAVAGGGGGGGGARSAGGGGGSSVASTPRNSFTPTVAPTAQAAQPATVTHKIQVVIAGRDLVGVGQITTDRLGRITGN